MLKRIFVLLVALLCWQGMLKSQWISLDPNSDQIKEADVEILSNTPSGTVIKVNLYGFFIRQFTAGEKTYQAIDLGTESVTTETGFPEVPYIAKVLAIPDNGTVEVEILNTGTSQKFENIYLPPARESWQEGEPETPYLENSESYNSGSTYPQNIASVEEPCVFRDFRIARVSVFPARYSPINRELEVYSSVTIRVNYGGGQGINPKLTPKRKISPSFAKLYRSFIFNYDQVLQERYDGREEGYDFMLCIMPDAFVDSFQTYAEWRHKTGTYIHVTKFSEIGASANNPTAVKDHILDAYTNWVVPPTHVLIVGDDGIAPVKYVSYDWTFVNEDYFVELEGNDYFPELMIGRFTNQGDYRLKVMVNKYMNYERNPYTQDQDWFKKATVCSNNEYISQVETKRFTAQVLMNDGNFISVDTLMSDGTWYSGCSMDLNDVIATINEGRSFLNYRGEGWSSGWSANCYSFHTDDVNTLNNGRKLTFVTSIGCGVAMFDANGGNCFGEAWVQLGTLTEPRGGVAFIGPTSNTHTTYNNKIDKGIYIGMFQEGMDSPGEALLRGKLYMYNVFGNIYRVEYHYRIYCLLGDPSLHVWKDIPLSVTVTHPNSTTLGFSQIPVTVKNAISGAPIENAQVCISGSGVYVVGQTDASGNLTLDITTSLEGNLNIAVTGGNVIPYEGTINVATGNENVAPLGSPVITDLDGNDDELIDPNENCTIQFTLKNWGTQTSYNVEAVLTVPDSIDFVQVITTGPVSFGDIAPDNSFTGTPFQFYVEPNCPVGFVIPFKLHVTSNSSIWDYTENELVHGCKIDFEEYNIDDEQSLLHNFRMDPGETVNVILTLANNGDDVAPEVKCILRSNDNYITIVDSIGTFGSILADSSARNQMDYFVVNVSPDCPLQYEANYSLIISTQNGLYPYSKIDSMMIPVAMPSGLDPTGPDAYGYYAYSSDDVLFEQCPEYEWVEINGIGTQIPKPAGVSDFTQAVGLPFTFRYYNNDFTQLRISSDGWIAFGSGTQVMSQNHILPNLDDIKNMSAIFWDDLFSNDPGETGKLLYYNDIDHHRFIIEWYEVGHYSDYTDRETFQIILFDQAYYSTSTGDGEILFQYKVVEEGGGCTVGIEDGSETIGLNYVYNEEYTATATEILSGTAIKFTTDQPTLVSVDGGKPGDDVEQPVRYVLEQNYPNPFNPETKIIYSIPEPGFVSLKIYNITGQLIRVLQAGNQLPGKYVRIWDGRNDAGNKLSSGVYFYEIQVNNFIQTKRMVLLK